MSVASKVKLIVSLTLQLYIFGSQAVVLLTISFKDVSIDTVFFIKWHPLSRIYRVIFKWTMAYGLKRVECEVNYPISFTFDVTGISNWSNGKKKQNGPFRFATS